MYRLGHFTHVIIDESGHTTEPESLVPLGLINKYTGQVSTGLAFLILQPFSCSGPLISFCHFFRQLNSRLRNKLIAILK